MPATVSSASKAVRRAHSDSSSASSDRDAGFPTRFVTRSTPGYTEPDPRTDLSGIDVARKALILARAIGFRGDFDDVAVESLVPSGFESLSRDEFIARLGELDDTWARRVRAAADQACVLRYRAHVTKKSIAVGLARVPVGGSLGDPERHRQPVHLHHVALPRPAARHHGPRRGPRCDGGGRLQRRAGVGGARSRYSSRIATSGSTRIARCAGIRHASSAIPRMTPATRTKVVGSVGVAPKIRKGWSERPQ